MRSFFQSLLIFLLISSTGFSWDLVPYIFTGGGSWNESRQMSQYLINLNGTPFSVGYGARFFYQQDFWLVGVDAKKGIHTWEYSQAQNNNADNSFSDSTASNITYSLITGLCFNSNKTSVHLSWSPYTKLTITPNIDRNYPFDQTYSGHMFGFSLNHQMFSWLVISAEYLKYSYNSFTQNAKSYNLPEEIETNVIYKPLNQTSIVVSLGYPWSF